MTITWTPSPDARTATFPRRRPSRRSRPRQRDAGERDAARAGAIGAADREIARLQQPRDDVSRLRCDAAGDPVEPDPYPIVVPKPLTPAPVLDTEFVIKSPAFGTERCFEIRPVDQVFGTVVIGPPSPRTCVTPKDTFPPAAPKNLAAIAGAGIINLIWDPNTESDLAGYLVLRGEAPGDTLSHYQEASPPPRIEMRA